ncbi:MAG: HD domain-containing protein [Nanoarchaeota archaeon]|nr:HD domain-containing protein [Nanoarchaeota archaeon]
MKHAVNFFYETGLLGRLRRTGFYFAGVTDPETIAAHSHRASVIAYVLAKMEKADAGKCALMCLLHDIPEARTGDGNKVAARYINFGEAEAKAFNDQTEELPEDVKKEFREIYNEFEERKTKEAAIAKDADLLECALEAKEHVENGFKAALGWIDRIKTALATESAKKLMAEIEKTKPDEWYVELKVAKIR